MSKTYTLNKAEVRAYDSGDDVRLESLMESLRRRFGSINAGGSIDIEVYHPAGYVIEQYMLSDEQLEALRDEARAANDSEQYMLCGAALRGDHAARAKCVAVIVNAASQEN